MGKFKITAGAVFVLLITIFALQNMQAVDVKFLFWGFSMSRAFMVFIIFAIGFLIGFFLRSLAAKQ